MFKKEEDKELLPGVLDGLTILRFAHAFETGAGTERYLDDLDRVLLERNAMRIIRLFIAREANHLNERVDQIGKGELIRIGLPLPEGESIQSSLDEEVKRRKLKEWVRDWILYNPLVWMLWTKRFLFKWRIPRRQGQVLGAGSKVEEVLARYHVDLIMLHFMGGSDADEIVEVARKRSIPLAVLNHYSNNRFLHLSIRKHAMLANGVASVNGISVPKYLRGRLFDLSDGIDTNSLRREKAKPLSDNPDVPIILLPARIVKTKGHLDLVKAGAILLKRGLDFKLAFAGRVDSAGFEKELRQAIASHGLSDKVLFLGLLSQEDLKNWYASSEVVAFPTYHHEGLPRILIEAQAMEVPPVAYATGGVPEGIADGKTGFLLRTGDVDGLANKVEELLRNKELRERMGEEGRRFVEKRFSLEAMAKRHEEFYMHIIKKSRYSLNI